jgi:2-polyprenyl-6-methoxyphenol hydroxylase-like FAD-dependent oxidoreductase
MQHPSIAIIGAGPAGLTAANILHRAGCGVEVFEGDASLTARDQGGTLDLHPDSGQLALVKAGLLDDFLAQARHEDQEQRVADYATGALLREEIPEVGTGDRPEIDRVLLRQLLLRPLPDELVHWGVRVEAVTALADGRHELRLVRAALTEAQPVYSGVTFVELWLNDVDARHPELAKLVGHGSMYALHGGVGIIGQRNGGDTVRVYAAFRTRPEETDRPDRVLADITKTELLERFKGWAPSLTALITDADRVAAVRPIVALPTETLRWEQRDGLTLVGDAAHVMPPMGVGVNLAMLDAAELAEALVTAQDWRQAVRDYEDVMLARAAETAVECNQAFADWFAADGEQALLDDMEARKEAAA